MTRGHLPHELREVTQFTPPSADALETIRRGAWIIALAELADADLAADVAQETVARLLDALARNGGAVRDPAAFARGIARHVIADIRARRKRMDPIEQVENSFAHSSITDPLATAIDAEQMERVRHALHSLSPADRDLLRALYANDLTPTELASRTGEPAERIRKRKSRALDRLRRAFFGHDSTSPTTADGETP